MGTAGIICEYNPLHPGHLRHMALTRARLGRDGGLVCVMSGDFVQRGEAAAYSKYARAEAAVRCGADAVFELPLPWCLASAEGFARGAVGLLGALGVELLSFGSEAGETGPLRELAPALAEPPFLEAVRRRMREEPSRSFAAVRQEVLAETLGENAALLSEPNNILAVEYLKAIETLGLAMEPFTVKRRGSSHDGTGGEEKSASELRSLLRQGRDVGEFLPPNALAVYRREEALGRGMPDALLLETALLSRLRGLEEERFCRLDDAGDGLGLRLCRAAREEPTMDALLSAVKTKRYPLARIRRLCLAAALGLEADMSAGIPPYARLLAANERGRALVRDFSRCSSLPILTKPAAVRELSEEAERIFTLGSRAHDLYVLGYRTQEERRGDRDWRTGPVIL